MEDVSLRSTRIRTLDRTQLAIPNGALAAMAVENLSLRDKILFRTTIALRSETTPDQLRLVLVEIRRLLYSHAVVEQQTARIRLAKFGESSLDLDLFCYVRTLDWDSYLAICEDILLRITDVIQQAGTALGGPSTTVYLSRDAGLNAVQQDAAHKIVQDWRDRNNLPFPDFASHEAEKMAGTVKYPDPAAASAQDVQGIS